MKKNNEKNFVMLSIKPVKNTAQKKMTTYHCSAIQKK